MGYGLSTKEDPSKNKDSDSISRRSRRMKKTTDRTTSKKEKEAEYEVEGILDHARDSKTNGRVFLVKWKGFSEEDASWEPEENFKPELIAAYDKVRRQRRKLAKKAMKESSKKEKFSKDKPAKPSSTKGILKKERPVKSSRQEKTPSKRAKTSERKSRSKKSKSDVSSESEEYEVEKIIEVDQDRGKVHIKWKGYSLEDSSWEPISSVQHLDVYKKFQAQSSRARSSPPSSKKRKMEIVANQSDSDDIVSWQPGESWEVERIVASRQADDGGVEYFIKWKGWPDNANTWEPSANVDSCRDALRAFTKQQQVKTSPAGSSIAQKKSKRG